MAGEHKIGILHIFMWHKNIKTRMCTHLYLSENKNVSHTGAILLAFLAHLPPKTRDSPQYRIHTYVQSMHKKTLSSQKFRTDTTLGCHV